MPRCIRQPHLAPSGHVLAVMPLTPYLRVMHFAFVPVADDTCHRASVFATPLLYGTPFCIFAYDSGSPSLNVAGTGLLIFFSLPSRLLPMAPTEVTKVFGDAHRFFLILAPIDKRSLVCPSFLKLTAPIRQKVSGDAHLGLPATLFYTLLLLGTR